MEGVIFTRQLLKSLLPFHFAIFGVGFSIVNSQLFPKEEKVMEGQYGPNTALVERFFARLREGLTLAQWIVVAQAGKFAQPWWDACQRAQKAADEMQIKNLLLAAVRDDVTLWYNTHGAKTAHSLVIGTSLALATKGKITEQEFQELYSPLEPIIPFESLKAKEAPCP